MKRLKKIIPLFVMSLIATVLLSSAVYASTWEYRYPIIITDTSEADRTYVPVVLGFGGQNLVNANKINANGLDTNMQSGVTDVDYMMSTAQVTTVIPSLPAGGKVQLDLYTGYSPLQTSFPIILGNGGYITTSDNAFLEWGNNSGVEITGYFDPTSTGSLVSKPNAFDVAGNGDGTIKIALPGGTPTVYPTISTNNAGSGQNTGFTATLPANSAGDLILIIVGTGGASAAVSTITNNGAGYTALSNPAAYGINPYWSFTRAYYKVSSGSEANPTFTLGGNNQYYWKVVVIQSGTYQSIPVVATNSGGSIDPPNLVSGFGNVKTLWVAFDVYAYSGSNSFNGAPAGYGNFTGSGVLGTYFSMGYADKQATAASDNPGVFSMTGAYTGYFSAYTIAISGYGETSATTAAISAGEHTITPYIGGGVIGISVDGGAPVTTAYAGSIVDNANDWEFCTDDIMAYCDNISMTVGGVEQLLYAPTSMLSGATLPDESADATDNPGTITWGTNTDLTITFGTPESYESYVATANITSGFTMPSAAMPSTWFSAGEGIASLPFYDMINQAATNAGIPAKTIYAWIIVGLAFCAFVSVIMYTRSAFMAVLAMSIVFFIGSSMTIVPMWIPFVILITDFGIMYLVKQVSY